jgi:hypothetical protein
MRTVLLLLALLALPARAEIEIRISVKFIHHPDGTAPGWLGGTWANISTYAGVAAEVARGNQVLAATGRGYRLRLNDTYANIQPLIPGDKPQDYWFNMDARANRQTMEDAAFFEYVWGDNVWVWSPDAINIFINNSRSGQCAFPANGGTISMGGSVGQGTLLHEIGHFFNLSHTHSGDPSCAVPGWVAPTTNAGLAALLTDGDGLVETIPDHPCYTRDELSRANFGAVYASLTAAQRTAVDSSWQNAMSYHAENALLPIQMDHWAWNANLHRAWCLNGYTIFVSTTGRDEPEFIEVRGYAPIYPLATPAGAMSAVLTPNDMVLFNGGTYTAPATPLATPCTLTATYGPAILTRP